MTYYIKIKPTSGGTITVPQYWEQQIINPSQSNIYYTTGNVGIGVPLPKASLHVVNNVGIGSAYATSAVPTDGLIVSGNVGIGTTLPTVKLDVVGTIKNTNPAFCVHNTATVTIVSTATKIAFAVVSTNIGGHFSTANNRFIAPVAGNYYFGFTAMTVGTASPIYQFYKNNSDIGNNFQSYGVAAQYSRGMVTCILTLAVGDYIELYIKSGGSLHPTYNQFTGYLIG